MDFLMALKPSGFWSNIIFNLEGNIKNYALTLIIITLIIKLVMIPFDFYNKYVTKVNARKQAVLQPELEKIKKRYANNPEIQNKMQMELYKKNNYNIVGTCLGMLVYMALTMVIFFTLLNSLNSISAYKITEEYATLKTEYSQVYDEKIADGKSSEQAVDSAQTAVVIKYGEIKEDFLWIKNIWRPDTSTGSIMTYKDYKATAEKIDKETEYNEAFEIEYNMIMKKLQESEEYSKWNGYFILSILSAGLTMGSLKLSTYISKRRAAKSGQAIITPANDTAKTMTLIMPIIMGIFTLLYNAAFGLYIVAGAIFSFITTPLITVVVDAIDYKKQENEAQKHIATYNRNKKG